jgi:hypothetical protein
MESNSEEQSTAAEKQMSELQPGTMIHKGKSY